MRVHLGMLFLLVSLMFACKEQPKDPGAERGKKSLALLSVDREFSQLCKTKGMKAAFIEYMDSNAVLLRPNTFPIIGANTIDYLFEQNDSAYALSWDPQHAEVSTSDDIGFTYGIYEIKPAAYDTFIYGTYTNCWKKQSDGKWKLILNTSNEGIGEH
jgi:hypothetical protein